MMTRREALGILQDVLNSFPEEKILHALEADAGPGYRRYASERFTDAQIRQAREALDCLRNTSQDHDDGE
jgi:hypothetical protein